MARENTWGYKRIRGELKKLGIKLSRSCIADILRRNGLPSSPERGALTWRESLSRHADVLLCAYHAPNANSFAERWIRSAREECLRHLVLFGIKSLRRAVHTYRRFFNEKRPHQGVGNRVPCRVRTGQTEHTRNVGAVGKVECDEFLGGLLKSYRRAAA
jgi:hypothetical protein